MQALKWPLISEELSENGYSLIKNALTPDQCEELILFYNDDSHFRKTISMERYRFGKGEYKYFNYPLPSIIENQRKQLYEPLSTIANDWMMKLQIDRTYPPTHEQLISLCNISNQTRPTPLILKYTQGGFNTIHQDLYGEGYFPFQVVFLLNQTGQHFEGGEFVLLQQNPRAQSKAIVVQPNRGDAIIFPTNFRPMQGARGYYPSVMKHGVSEVRSGMRYSLGIIFHDAT